MKHLYFIWVTPDPFRSFSVFFKQTPQFFVTNKCEKYTSSIRHWDLDSRPLEHKSPPYHIHKTCDVTYVAAQPKIWVLLLSLISVLPICWQLDDLDKKMFSSVFIREDLKREIIVKDDGHSLLRPSFSI